VRRAISVFTVVFLVFVSFGVLVGFDITTENAVAASMEVTGTYNSGTLTWSGTVYVVGDVTITSGAEVTINPGTEVIFNSTTYSITVDSGGSLNALGNLQQGDVTFKILSGRWNTIIVQNTGYANFTHCQFLGSNNGISLSNNNYRTYIANCSFFDTGNYYFSLSTSKVDVVSTDFENNPFEAASNFTTNINRVDINDEISEIFIEYFVEIETRNGLNSPIKDISIDGQQSGRNKSALFFGKTDATGRYSMSRATAFRIFGMSNKKADFNYSTSVDVYDKWDGGLRAEPGISRQIININNVSNDKNNNSLKYEKTFVFNYPPRIDTSLAKVIVKEDKQQTTTFKFHDNDDLLSMVQDGSIKNKFDNITIYIEDQDGNDIYDIGNPANTGKSTWIKWSNGTASSSDPYLVFYRTIESPFTVSGSDDYRQKVTETINITIEDGLGNSNKTEFEVEFQNVPDKPAINFATTTEVTEDSPKYMAISIADNDNVTGDIEITSDSPYVSYQKSNSTLKLVFPNEFGGEGDQQLVNISATDNCFALVDATLVKNVVTQSFNVVFHQTPDPPIIKDTIPDMVGNETDWTSALDLKDYWEDPDPDEDADDLSWFVTGVNTNIFEVSGDNVTANTPLVFNLKPDTELGGADNPTTIEDDVTIWLIDKYGLKASQGIKLKLSSTNLQPSLHKIEKSATERITVEPETGNSEEYFKFMIEYKDQDGENGDVPDFVKVIIDNISYDMIAMNENDKNYKDGKSFYYETKLTPGTHMHYFICSDGLAEVRHPEAPNIIELPIIESKIYIEEFKSTDENIIIHMGYSGAEGDVTISFTADPEVTQEKNKGNMEEFFRITTKDVISIHFIDFTILFGDEYQNYGTKWLRKEDMQLAYLKDDKWVPFLTSIVNKNKQLLKCNVTPEPSYGYDTLFENLVTGATPQTKFTVIGWLDADGDGYFNDEDSFPFDPAARYDRDGDGSPGDTEWVPGKSAKDSTSSPKLHEDKFPDDPAASVNDDGDECPDEWNPGQSAANSTTNLTLDMFPNNPEACLDTDGDNQPDGDTFNTKDWMDRDDDDDGMLDHWENRWNDYALDEGLSKRFNTKDGDDASQDWDGDGRDNLQEYKDDTNPFKKDSKDDGSILEGDTMTYVVIALIVVVIILVAIFAIVAKRKKSQPEDMPRGMGGAPPPEEDVAPPVSSAEEPEQMYDENQQFAEEGYSEDTGVEEGYEQVPPTMEGEGVARETEEPEMTIGTEAEDSGMETSDVPVEEPAADMDMEVPEEPAAGEETPQQNVEAAQELQYTCPNCNTPVTPDMPECPGCQTPLTFE
jgi:hypothetical protein